METDVQTEDRPASVGKNRRMGRAEDVLSMQSAARTGGTQQVLRWLADRAGTDAVLVHASGAVTGPSAPSSIGSAPALRQYAVREFTNRRLTSMVIDQADLTCFVSALAGSGDIPMPLLTVVAHRPASPELPVLLADAASVLSLTWQREQALLKQRRVRIAEGRVRETVLRLLMSGHTVEARAIAETLHPALPELLQVYVVEGPPEAREKVAQQVAVADAGAWIVPCPVYSHHMLVLASAPAPRETLSSVPHSARVSTVAHTCRVGVSNPVPLRETSTGYAQAFHALAAARRNADRLCTFSESEDLALAIGPAASTWADSFLAPLRAHHPKRPQDPGGTELLVTAASWISFSSGATAHLKIHRNTLTARLSHISELLHLDLDRLADQSALALALRISAAGVSSREEAGAMTSDPGTAVLDDLLMQPHVAAWAGRQFHALRGAGAPRAVADTLTAWLRLDARIGLTADQLRLSTSAVRKRLARAEELLCRSLTRSPSHVHDLWLARRALELAERCDAPRAPVATERQAG